jgi:hypothetical protein
MLRVKQRVEKKERVESMIKPHMLKKLYGKVRATLRLCFKELWKEKSSYIYSLISFKMLKIIIFVRDERFLYEDLCMKRREIGFVS